MDEIKEYKDSIAKGKYIMNNDYENLLSLNWRSVNTKIPPFDEMKIGLWNENNKYRYYL